MLPRVQDRMLAALCLPALLIGCGDAAGPRGGGAPPPPVPVFLGDTVLVDLTHDSFPTFVIEAGNGMEFAVFALNELGDASVYVWDSAHPQSYLSSIHPGSDTASDHLALYRTDRMSIGAGQRMIIGVYRGTVKGRTRFWVYPVNRAPELAPPTLTPGTSGVGETLENTADVDEYTVSLSGGSEVMLYGRRLSQAGPIGLLCNLFLPDGGMAIAPIGLPSAADVQGGAFSKVQPPYAGTYRIRVATEERFFGPTTAAPLSYQLQMRVVDRAPEATTPLIAVGDTVMTEAIDYVGDVDDFQVALVAGTAYKLFLLNRGGPPGLALRGWPLGASPPSYSGPVDTAMALQSTPRFTPDTTGVFTIRFEGDGANGLRGPYRFFVYRINRAPEVAPATLTAGQAVSEPINYPGDIDEFTVVAGVDDSVQLRLLRPGTVDGMTLRWGPPGQVTEACPTRFPTSDTACSTWIVPIPPGGLTVEALEPDGPAHSFRGSYALQTTGISAAPEAGPATIAIGDTIAGSIEVEADVDAFSFPYQHAEVLEVGIVPTGGALLATASVIDGGYTYYTWGQDPTGPFTIATSGTRQVVVSGTPGSTYAFVLRAYPRTPESVPEAVTLADSVTGEALDPVGDLDEFALSAPAGTAVQAFITIPQPIGTLQMEVWLPGDTTPILRRPVPGGSSRFTVPPGGEARIRLRELRGSGSLSTALGVTTPYGLWFRSYDPAPESVPAALALGVPVSGELLDAPGDLDEFTLTCSAGQTITGFIAGGIPIHIASEDPIAVQLLDPTTGAVLGSATTNDSETESTGPIVLTSGGTCRVRVTGALTTATWGGYTLVVQ